MLTSYQLCAPATAPTEGQAEAMPPQKSIARNKQPEANE